VKPNRYYKRIVMVWFGLGGSHADLDCRRSPESRAYLSGYDSPESFFATHDPSMLRNGAYVIDKRDALRADPGKSFRGPLVDITRTPSSDEQITPLAQVSIETYVRYWRDAGARVGRWQSKSNSVVWEAS
jgi:hypothetical protein